MQDRYPRRHAEYVAANGPLAPGAARAAGRGAPADSQKRVATGSGIAAFDAAAFKTAWRARCAEFGIDPATGPTAYQVEFVRGHLAWPQHRGIDWLRYVPLAKSEAMDGRDSFENARFADVERAARDHLHMIDEPEDPVDVSLPTLRELWVEVKRELMKDDVPLRAVHMLQLTMDSYLADLQRDFEAAAGRSLDVGAGVLG